MVSIEVASRGNTPDDLHEKVNDCLVYGAAEVCVIYPKTRTMLVHRPGGVVISVAADADYHSELLSVTFTPQLRTPFEQSP
jgi:hypothetical protein